MRRLGWEFDGMRLHEYYFDNLTNTPTQRSSGRLYDTLGAQYGSVEAWKKDLRRWARCVASVG